MRTNRCTSVFEAAINKLGGPLAAAGRLGRKQPTISGYIKDGNAPAEVCMRIEIETAGEYRAEELRPDLAEMFVRFRRLSPAAIGGDVEGATEAASVAPGEAA